MKCPYPDCTGQVTLGEQFCGECGRALTWENGQPRPVGAVSGLPPDPGATRVMNDMPQSVLPPPPPPTTPGGGGIYPSSAPTEAYMVPPVTPQPGGSGAYPPPGTPPMGYTPPPMGATPPMGGTPPGYTAPMGAPPPGYTPPTAALPATPARSGPNRMLLIVGGAIGGIVVLCIICSALGILGAALGTPTPTVPPATRVTVKLPTATTRALGRATPTTGTVANTPVVPVDTPVPEDTPVPTDATPGEATPDAVATAAASDFDLDFTDYTDASGADIVVGTAHNKGTDRLENVKITAELLDATGATVGTGDDIMLPLAVMEGDQTLPFQVRIASPGEGAERIHVQIHADVYDPTNIHIFDQAQKLSVEGTTLGKGVLGPNITGRVRNDGTKAATLVTVIAAGYDSSGALVDTGTGYITSDVEPGTTSPFELMFLRPDVEIAKFDIVVLGQEKP